MGKSSSIRAQPKHKCSCCGKIGHNIKQCPAPAAKELIHLRAAVKGFLDGRPQNRFKGRLPVKKNSGPADYRAAAKKEYSLCQNTNLTRKMTGDIEADAHGIRKLYISNKNRMFSQEVAEATERFKRAKPDEDVPKYWQAHFRVLGLKARTFTGHVQKRGGKIVIKALPFKLVPPGASPPVESKREILQSDILKHLGDPKMIRMYSDGAKAWESIYLHGYEDQELPCGSW